MTPLLVLLIIGILEVALLMRHTVAVTSAVRVGARIASVSAGAGPGVCLASVDPPPCTPASAPGLAQAAADAIQRAGSAMPREAIESIMIYEANQAGFPAPEGNTTLTCSSRCVEYVWDSGVGRFRYARGTWDSSSINACVNDPDLAAVGVAMIARHDFLTGLLWSSQQLAERTVMQFEPLPTEQCKPGDHA